jgi:hypothetical protein
MTSQANEPHCVCHLVRRGGCAQGRACPIAELEVAIAIEHRAEFPAPKGKQRMSNYRNSSSAWTGRAPRTLEQRWPSAPISAPASWLGRFRAWLFGR